ncbi:MAG: ABC transporter ATP-binding protein [Proteobacteria bacterium]|nr:ABC transporter ATP-binding protein [Desulfobacterales bacterium]MBU0734965.1 ABC transporter ATP-binding protein [Pseudomonadota bacterium]MBU1902411.1 ABC transporter ATP-binding protein [Pseudomonadota bacterium]
MEPPLKFKKTTKSKKHIWEAIEVLRLEDINTYYGDSHILKGVSFEIKRGELVTLLGRNGAGKSTTLKSIMGIVPPAKGTISFDGYDVSGQKPHRIASLGMGYVPEERAIFPSLSVSENLKLPMSRSGVGLWPLEKIFSYFPVLERRRHHKGSQLSGGEQQMLAIARILIMRVKIILLDEPTEGLAPMLVREIAQILKETKKTGITMLLVEQNTRFAVEIANRHNILHEGKIAYQGDNDEFKADEETQRKYLAV